MLQTPAPAREPDMVHFEPVTLHERMMIEAETQIQHNWTDVAIHDKRKLRTVSVDHACIWVVKSEGSALLPTYCKLSERKKWQADGPVCQLVAFVSRCQDFFLKFRSNYDPRQDSYYIIVKRHGVDGDIIPVSFDEVASLIFSGAARWTENGFQPIDQQKA